MKHKKVIRPEVKIKKKRAEKIINKIKNYEKELKHLQEEIDILMMEKIKIRIFINKLELNLKSI